MRYSLSILLATLLITFSSSIARSQDALAAFVFLFVDDSVDVSKEFGREWSKKYHGGVYTAKYLENCKFEITGESESYASTGRQLRLRIVEVYDLNKAFMSEAKVDRDLSGYFLRIDGEDGLLRKETHCLSDSETCEWGSGMRDVPRVESNTTKRGYYSDGRRAERAIQFLATNYCKGKKRPPKPKTAF